MVIQRLEVQYGRIIMCDLIMVLLYSYLGDTYNSGVASGRAGGETAPPQGFRSQKKLGRVQFLVVLFSYNSLKFSKIS